MAGIAEVEETGQFILVLKDFSLEPPHLSIEVRSLDRDGGHTGSKMFSWVNVCVNLS